MLKKGHSNLSLHLGIAFHRQTGGFVTFFSRDTMNLDYRHKFCVFSLFFNIALAQLTCSPEQVKTRSIQSWQRARDVQNDNRFELAASRQEGRQRDDREILN